MIIRSTQLCFSLILIFLATEAMANCARPVLSNERQDAETVRKIESAWSRAYLTGDTGFEACILTPDFTEIASNGAINDLNVELAKAGKNKGKEIPNILLPTINVHLHNNVAVAYGLSSEKVVDGKLYKSYFADYYVWSKGAWRVYFSQQTTFLAQGS